jgi:Rad3-related DNA helicase
MEIDAPARSVRLSVGELARFRSAPTTSSGTSGQWRATLGQEWHQIAAEQIQTQYPEARFEETIKAIWRHRDWTFHIQGRIDQIIPIAKGQLTLREIKTIRMALPMPEEELVANYPHHLAQVAIYLNLARVLPEFECFKLNAELCWIDIDHGTLQVLPLSEESAQTAFTQQLDTLIPFLNDRRDACQRLQETTLKPPFESLREGQADFQVALEKACQTAPTILLQAPTGFGKTGLVLQEALKSLKNGVYDRCLFLSSQSTGQVQTRIQLETMLGDGLRSLQMRNRQEHRIESTLHTCTGDPRCETDLAVQWERAGLRPEAFFKTGNFELEQAKTIGRESGVCPYAITKSCLPYAEVWIGDSNYVFNPASKGVFENVYGFNPARTCLIIDEAHNLPKRAADALSLDLRATEFLFALDALQTGGAKRQLLATGRALAYWIDQQTEGATLPPNKQYEVLDLAEDFARQFQNARFDYAMTPPFALELAHRIKELATALAEPSHQFLAWVPTKGILRASCLDPRAWIAECLRPFGSRILMSATLKPFDDFLASCGLDPKPAQTHVVEGHAPWRDSAYEMAIDLRVDTRLKNRHLHYATTAHSAAALVQKSPGVPVIVFLSSYQYAENIRTYLEATYPEIRARVQPRGVDLAKQEHFIESSLLQDDVIFLILGSSYAESIDALGGQIRFAMVVGPALPEVNCIQQARAEAHPANDRSVVFRDLYLLPGMRRIHQALGRLVRAPGQKTTILLQGKRFAEAEFHNQLAPEYQSETLLNNDNEFFDWLDKIPN